MDSTCLSEPEFSDPLQIGVDGIPFSVLLSRAVKLKSWQMAQSRSKYDSFPEFYKDTIFPRSEITVTRQKTFKDQIAYAYTLIEEAREAFENSNYSQAYSKFALTLSIFRYLHNKNCNWRNEGIRDSDIVEVTSESDDDEERREIRLICLKCYTNIALTALKLKSYKVSLDACQAALSIDGRNVKALFLRSKARSTPVFRVSNDLQLALQDLNMAIQINPDNKHIRREIIKLKADMTKEQRSFKKLFQKSFKRMALGIDDHNLGEDERTIISDGVIKQMDHESLQSGRGNVVFKICSKMKCGVYESKEYVTGTISILTRIFSWMKRFSLVVAAALIMILSSICRSPR